MRHLINERPSLSDVESVKIRLHYTRYEEGAPSSQNVFVKFINPVKFTEGVRVWVAVFINDEDGEMLFTERFEISYDDCHNVNRIVNELCENYIAIDVPKYNYTCHKIIKYNFK